MKGRFVPQSHRNKLNCNSVVILLIEFFMNNIQELVIDKVKALSLNQQKTVLYFIDKLLTPNVIDSTQKLEVLLMEGVDSLEWGEGIVVTDDWWEQERDQDKVFDPSPEQIAASLHKALHEVKTGQIKPISQLWDSLDGK
jgi:hypothetical protein